MATESDLQIQVAEYLTLRYPDVLFHSDYGSGAKLTPGQAVRQKRQNGGRRAWPDIVIAEEGYIKKRYEEYDESRWNKDEYSPFCGGGYAELICHALYLELKKEGEKLYPGPRAKNRFKSKDGNEYKNEHIMEQADCLYELRQREYCAEFAIGFEEAKKIIDEYLGGE